MAIWLSLAAVLAAIIILVLRLDIGPNVKGVLLK
jgi:hypothetical protein